jgi:alpha-N-arabinofuranosidase
MVITSYGQGYDNPIIPGFYPDPSVCVVGDDYYLVTSSFEYFPGIPIFHSKDLVNWEQIGHCLTRDSQLNLEKCRVSGGLYAPTIRYHKGVFYMINTNVSDKGNFYVTATDPAGEWSEPIWVKQGGIDPSLFWDDDDDETAYFVSNEGAKVGGLAVSKIDLATGALLSEPVSVWLGNGGRYPEAPHIYKKDGYYYLLIAEGGTEYAHSVTIARAKDIFGPYESCPFNPILTHSRRLAQGNQIQGTGHADLIQASDGSWWTVFLGFRTIGKDHHILGRETFLAPVSWPKGGWPLVNGGNPISLKMDVPTLPRRPFAAQPVRDDFDGSAFGFQWNYLRNPARENYSLTDKKGYVSLRGAAVTLDEIDNPTFLGRRQQHLQFTATTQLEFSPSSSNEIAGLTVFMNNLHHYDVYLKNKHTLVLRYKIGNIDHIEKEVAVKGNAIQLRVEGKRDLYTFSYSDDEGKTFLPLGTVNTYLVSTETAGGFTGVYLALYATGNGKPSKSKARFAWFDYFDRSDQ